VVPAAVEHDIHLSLCELRFNESSSSFEISFKIFIDDLELAIQRDGNTGFRVGDNESDAEVDKHIAAYLNKVFSIEIDGNKLQGEFVGKEITDDLLAVWCYVQIPVKHTGKKCLMTNRILLDVYNDQRNIMDIRMNKSHKDYIILESRRYNWSYTYPNQ
jgi:hypothetical protein